jgi:uncharacterized membrane protein
MATVRATALVGRYFVATAMLAFGVQHFVYSDFVTRLVPGLPPWIPWHPFWACLIGATLIVAAVAIMLGKEVRAAAALLGTLGLASFLLLHLPIVIASPQLGYLWTNAGKALALSGAAFLVAATQKRDPADPPSKATKLLDGLIFASPFFLAAFLVLCGVQHFLYTTFVASLVPAWIPGHLFWAYFAGVALIAAGAAIINPVTQRVAALLTAIMVFLWLSLVHIPTALASVRDSSQTTAVFEALAISGAALVVTSMSFKEEH